MIFTIHKIEYPHFQYFYLCINIYLGSQGSIWVYNDKCRHCILIDNLNIFDIEVSWFVLYVFLFYLLNKSSLWFFPKNNFKYSYIGIVQNRIDRLVDSITEKINIFILHCTLHKKVLRRWEIVHISFIWKLNKLNNSYTKFFF